MCLVGGVDDVLAAAISSTVGRHIGRLNVEDCKIWKTVDVSAGIRLHINIVLSCLVYR